MCGLQTYAAQLIFFYASLDIFAWVSGAKDNSFTKGPAIVPQLLNAYEGDTPYLFGGQGCGSDVGGGWRGSTAYVQNYDARAANIPPFPEGTAFLALCPKLFSLGTLNRDNCDAIRAVGRDSGEMVGRVRDCFVTSS